MRINCRSHRFFSPYLLQTPDKPKMDASPLNRILTNCQTVSIHNPSASTILITNRNRVLISTGKTTGSKRAVLYILHFSPDVIEYKKGIDNNLIVMRLVETWYRKFLRTMLTNGNIYDWSIYIMLY